MEQYNVTWNWIWSVVIVYWKFQDNHWKNFKRIITATPRKERNGNKHAQWKPLKQKNNGRQKQEQKPGQHIENSDKCGIY
jgi:hypothetical protein